MIQENQELLNKLNIFSDAMIVFVSFLLGYYVRFYLLPGGQRSVPFHNYVEAAVILAILSLCTFTIMGMYESRRNRQLYQEFGNIMLADLIGLVFLMMGLFVIKNVHMARLALISSYLIETALLCLKRYVMYMTLHRLRAKGYNQKKVLLIGGKKSAFLCFQEIRDTPELGYRIVGYVSGEDDWEELQYLGGFDRLEQILAEQNPDEVIACLGAEGQERIMQIISACERNGTKLSIVPFYVQYLPAHPQFDFLGNVPMLNVRRVPLDNVGNAFLKRAMDLTFSLVLLVATLPLMAVLALGVKFSSPGPVIFCQERVGRGQKCFPIYKFRSMRLEKENVCNSDWSKNSDTQMTKFGAWIRKYSLDELPQLWNVLKGDMSLVGPRPELPVYVEQFKKEIPLYMVKHQVKPGITGWAQVHGLRGNTSLSERIRHDIFYIENWSIWLDFKILLMTIGKLKNNE